MVDLSWKLLGVCACVHPGQPMLSNVSSIYVLFCYTCIQKVKYLSGHKIIAAQIQSDAFLCC